MKRKQPKTTPKTYSHDVQYLRNLGYKYAAEMPAFLKMLNQYLKEHKITYYPVAMAPDEMTTFIDQHKTLVYDACHMAHRYTDKLREQKLYHKRSSLATVYFVIASTAGIPAARSFMSNVCDPLDISVENIPASMTLRSWLCDRGWRRGKEQWLQVTVAEEVAAWITTWNNLQSGSMWSLKMNEMLAYPVPLKLRQRTMPRKTDTPMKKEQARKPSKTTKKPHKFDDEKRAGTAAPVRSLPVFKHARKHYVIPGHLLVADAAVVLDCGHSHLYKWIKSGYLTGKKPHAGGLWQVPAIEIENMAAGRDPKKGLPTQSKPAPTSKQQRLDVPEDRSTLNDLCDIDDVLKLCTLVEMLPVLDTDTGRVTTSKVGLNMVRELASKVQDSIAAEADPEPPWGPVHLDYVSEEDEDKNLDVLNDLEELNNEA